MRPTYELRGETPISLISEEEGVNQARRFKYARIRDYVTKDYSSDDKNWSLINLR